MLEILVWCHSSWTGCILCLHSSPQLLYRLFAAFSFLQQLLCSLMLVRSFGRFPFHPNSTLWLQVESHPKCPALAQGLDHGPSFTFRLLFPDCGFSASEFQSKLALSLWPVGRSSVAGCSTSLCHKCPCQLERGSVIPGPKPLFSRCSACSGYSLEPLWVWVAGVTHLCNLITFSLAGWHQEMLPVYPTGHWRIILPFIW